MNGVGAILTESWFARARAALADRSFGDIDLQVQYLCGDEPSGEVAHHQRFVRGRLMEWAQGRVSHPDLCLRQAPDVHLGMLLRTDLGEGVLRGTELVDPRTGDVSLPPPLDEVQLPWADELPLLPTVGEFVFQQILIDSPFGDVGLWARVDRGRIVEIALGTAAAPDVTVWRQFAMAMRERLGVVDVLESIEGGHVAGDLRKVTVFLGLYETEECIEGRRALPSGFCEPLARLGEVLSSREWFEGIEGLRAVTGDVWSIP